VGARSVETLGLVQDTRLPDVDAHREFLDVDVAVRGAVGRADLDAGAAAPPSWGNTGGGLDIEPYRLRLAQLTDKKIGD